MPLLIRDYWPCVHPADKQVMLLLAQATQTPHLAIPRSAAVAVWLSYYGAPVAAYRDAFMEWAVITQELIEGQNWWLADQIWMLELYTCFLEGDCLDELNGCSQFNFPTYPS